jgi:dihydroxyacid dehydratase/phosphogluconate dehydratase
MTSARSQHESSMPDFRQLGQAQTGPDFIVVVRYKGSMNSSNGAQEYFDIEPALFGKTLLELTQSSMRGTP